MGSTPCAGMDPADGFIPTVPLSDDGQIIDPSVSLPIAHCVIPAATAAPEPEEDPPAFLR